MIPSSAQPAPGGPLGVESLLEYEPFVRSVARGLLQDEAQVEDVVQETWIRAMRRPPRPEGSVQAWLARVVRNLVKDLRRGEGRRRDRESRVAVPESAADARTDGRPADLAMERLEAHRRVVEAVLALDEPYRGVVLLAYYEGLKPAEIAERLGRPAATVRTQLCRAHAVLRERLDADFDGDRRGWAILALPMGVPLPAPEAAPLLPVALTRGLLATAVVVPLVLFGRALLPVDEPRSASDSDLVGTLPLTGAEGTTERREPDAGAPDRTVVAPEGPGLEVRLVDAGGALLPLAGARAWLLEDRRPAASAVDLGSAPGHFGPLATFRTLGQAGEVDALGRARFASDAAEGLVLVEAPDPARPGGLLVAVAELRDAELRYAEHRRIDLTPTPSRGLALRVLEADGSPATGAVVELVGHRSSEDLRAAGAGPSLRGVTGPDGTLSFNGVDLLPLPATGPPPTVWTLAARIPGAVLPIRTLRPGELAPVGDDQPTVELHLPPTAVIDVSLVDADGAPLAVDGTAVGRGEHAEVEVELVAGRARLDHLAPGVELELLARVPELGGTWRSTVVAPAKAGDRRTVELVVDPEPHLVGRALGPQGAPLASTDLALSFQDRAGRELQRRLLRTDPQGAFQVALDLQRSDLQDRRFRVMLLGRGLRGWTQVAEWRNRTFPVTGPLDLGDARLEPRSGYLHGRCVDPEGRPVSGIRVWAAQAFTGLGDEARTGPDGRFELLGLWPRRVSVGVEAEGHLAPDPIPTSPGQDLELVLAPGAQLDGSIVVDPGIPATTFSLRARAASGETADLDSVGEDGSFSLTPLAAGTYEVEVLHRGRSLRHLGAFTLGAGERLAPVALAGVDLRGTYGVLELTVLDPDGQPVPNPVAWILPGPGARSMARLELVGDAGRLDLPKAPRAWGNRVVARAPGFRPVLVQGIHGDELEPLVLEPALAVELELVDPRDLDRRWDLALERDGGLFDGLLPGRVLLEGAGRTKVELPAPGTYRVVRRPSRGTSASEGWEPLPGAPDLTVVEGSGRLVLTLP